MQRNVWLERLGSVVIVALLLVAFAGCMAVANLVGGRTDDKPCTITDVNAGVDRCQPDYPPELPSGSD